MTKQAAIFCWMPLREGYFFILAMAVQAKLFRLFFTHGHKPCMVIIMGKIGCGLGWGAPEKEKKPTANKNKQYIINQGIFFSSH